MRAVESPGLRTASNQARHEVMTGAGMVFIDASPITLRQFSTGLAIIPAMAGEPIRVAGAA